MSEQSPREILTNDIWDLICELGLNTSPTSGPVAGTKYRSVFFGLARLLDGEIRIYGPKFFLYRDSRNRQEKFVSYNDLRHYLRTEVCHLSEDA